MWDNLKEATKMAKVTVFRMFESTIVVYSPNFVQKRNPPFKILGWDGRGGVGLSPTYKDLKIWHMKT